MNKKKNKSLFILPKLLMTLVLLLLLVGTAVGSYFLFKRSQEGAEKAGKSPSSQIEKEQEQKEEEPQSEFEGENRPFFLDVFNPEDGLKLTTDQVIVRGRTLPDVEVFVNEFETKADSQGNFSLRVTLEEGENPIIISAGNESGEAEIERTVYYEK